MTAAKAGETRGGGIRSGGALSRPELLSDQALIQFVVSMDNATVAHK